MAEQEILDYPAAISDHFLIELDTPGMQDWTRRRLALENLARLRVLRAEVEQAIVATVKIARAHKSADSYYGHGAQWTEIAKALGVTKQAAAQRYGKTER